MNKEKDTEKTNQLTPNRLDEIVVPASIFLDRLTDFLGSSEGQTTEEVKAELREQGIDVDAFLSEAKTKIKTYIEKAKLGGNDGVPQLKRGKVWCRKCGKEQAVDSNYCLSNGWPKCCEYTMTIDHPSTWGNSDT